MYPKPSFHVWEGPLSYRDGRMQQKFSLYIISKNHRNFWTDIPLIFYSTPFDGFPSKVFFMLFFDRLFAGQAPYPLRVNWSEVPSGFPLLFLGGGLVIDKFLPASKS